MATKLLVITYKQLRKNEKSLKFAAKKTRINIRKRVCFLRGYPGKGFDRNPRTCATGMQIRINIYERLPKVIYLTLMQRVELWESGLDGWMTS